MRIERADKLVPLTLVSVTALAIILRIGGVLPPILVSDDPGMSQTLFMDAGIGALISVFSIVISLTLMSVQTASQEYTHRIMKTYLRSFMLWAMIIIYIGTALYDLYMVAFLKTPVNTVYADITVILVTLSLILLVPHFVITVAYLRPDIIVGTILRTVDGDYLTFVRNELTAGSEQIADSADRLLPAVEIIEKCIGKRDRATVRVALDEINGSYKQYVNAENEKPVTGYFMSYYLRIAREAITEGDDDTIVQVLGMMAEIGRTAAGVEIATAAIGDINTVGIGSLKGDYDAAVEEMIDSLRDIALARPSGEIPVLVLDSYSELIHQLFQAQKKRTTLHLIDAMMRLKELLTRSEERALVVKWSGVMEEIGLAAVQEKAREIAQHTVLAYCETGSALARAGKDSARYTIESLLRIEHEIDPADRELIGEIEYARRRIDGDMPKKSGKDDAAAGLDTSDLWR